MRTTGQTVLVELVGSKVQKNQEFYKIKAAHLSGFFVAVFNSTLTRFYLSFNSRILE
jgi:hypothetical protein